MIGNFAKLFGKRNSELAFLPEEVLKIANEELPSNFIYQKTEDGNYHAIPVFDDKHESIVLKTNFDLSNEPELLNRLRIIPRDKWHEYLYRTQKAVPVKDLKFGDDEKVVPIELLSSLPFQQDNIEITNIRLMPYAFANSIPIVLEDIEGDKIELLVRQQAYDNISEIMFKSINFPALSVTIFEYSSLNETIDEGKYTNKQKKVCVNYSLRIQQAENATVAIQAARLFKGFLDGTVKINGHPLQSSAAEDHINKEKIESIIQFWNYAVKLEEILKVSFDPSADFPSEDRAFFFELVQCYINKRPLIHNHPFDHFHIGDYHPSEAGQTIERYINKGTLRYVFVEGPVPATLLGAEFDIYCINDMKGFIVKSVEWDDEKKNNGEVFIDDANSKPWTLSILYVTKEEAEDMDATLAKART